MQAGQEMIQAEQRMAKALNDVEAKLSDKLRPALQQAQQAWLRFRDAECTFETADSVGGSIHPMLLYGCKRDLTVERTRQLERQLNCPEGDLSCVR